MRVITQPDTPESGTKKIDLSWRCFKAGFWTFIKPLAFLLFFFSIYSLDAQTNIKGLAPMLEPKGGLAVDGNAFVNSPGDDPTHGDWLFESGDDLPGDTPGGVFPPSASDEFAAGIPEGPLPDDFYLYPGQTMFFRDNITNNDPTIFTSSNKINDDPNTYTIGTGSSPNKNEIQNAIAHFSFADPSIAHGNAGDLWLAFAADRQVINGSSYIDFEVLQAPLTILDNGNVQSLGPDGGRTEGDILITIEFTNGGGAASVVTRRWVPNGSGFIYETFTSVAGTIFGTENDVETIVPYSIYFQDPINEAGFYQYSVNQWAEGAVNISSFFPDDPCLTLSTLFVRTRTSGNSTKSELKDLPGKPFQISLDLTPPAPELADQSACDSWNDTLTAEGCEGSVKWYDAAEGGNLLFTGAEFSPGPLTETTSFWASCTVDECEGPRAMVTVTIFENPTADAGTDDADCYDDGAGSIALDGSASGGTAPYTYSWSPDTYLDDASLEDPTFSGAPVGTYILTLTVTDDNGCEDTDMVDLEIYENPTADAGTDDSDCDDDGTSSIALDGSASGGTAPYSYSWSPDTYLDDASLEDPTFSGAPAGSYTLTLTVTDDNGCEDTDMVDLEIYENPIADAGTDDADCYDDGAGSIALDGSASGGTAPYSYSWSPDTYLDDASLEDPTFSGAPVGTYTLTLTVTDDNGCEDTDMVDLEIYENPTADAGTDDADCYDDGAGSIALDGSASGGTAPYTYSWTPDTYLDDASLENPTFSGAPVGTYILTLTVTDDNGCEDTDMVDLEIYENPTADAGTDDSDCDDDGTSSIALDGSASGGTAPYSYSWSPDTYLDDASLEDPTFSGAPAGSYTLTLTVTDDNGCEDTDMVDLEIYENPIADAGTDDADCYDDGAGSIALDGSASGGTAPYSYSWSPDTYLDDASLEDPTFSGAPVGTYTLILTITDDNGCEDTDMVDLEIYENPTATATGGILPCDDSGFQLMGSGSGGSSPYTYSWAGPGGFTSAMQNPTVFEAGEYELTVTDDNGCEDTDTAKVSPPENCAHIFPTQTDCEEYRCITQSTDPEPIDFTLSNVCVTLNGSDVITNAVPGVFFYYADVTGKAGSTTVLVDQDSDMTKYFLAQNAQNVRVYSSECGTITPTAITIYDHGDGADQGDVEITFASTAGTAYIISVKYDVKTSIGGMLVDSDPYASFSMEYGNGDSVSGSSGQISLNSDANCDPDPLVAPDSCELDSALVETNDTVSTQNLLEESSFSVAPVPFKETVNVRYEFDYTSDVRIQFFDLNGSLLRTYADKQVSNGDETQINIDFALRSNQVYIVRVETDRGSFSKSILSGN